MTLTETVAANVRAEVARSGYTQNELALAIGKSKQAISQKVNATTPFTFNELEAIANWLSIDVQVLMKPVHSNLIAA